MGMFDYIKCEFPLPDGAEICEFQTKDFDCEMVTHVINKSGRLMFERVDETLIVPKSERPYPDGAGILALCGSMRRIKSTRDSNFHGLVNFYGHDTAKVWHEYNAKFTDGNLVEIIAVKDNN